MRKLLVLFIVIAGTLITTGVFGAGKTEVLRLDQEDIINNLDGNQAVFKMVNTNGTKDVFIENMAIDYLCQKNLQLKIVTPKISLILPPNAWKLPEWQTAVKTGEPVTAKISLKPVNSNMVREDFDEWCRYRAGLYRFGNIGYELTSGILVRGQEYYTLTKFAAQAKVILDYSSQEVPSYINENTVEFYYWDEKMQEFVYAGGKVNKADKIITISTAQTGSFIALSNSKGPSFSDINGHWAKQDIIFMAEKNVLQQKNGDFIPDKEITREEFAACLVAILHINEQVGVKPFKDVSLGSPYYQEIILAVGAGLVTGTGDGRFEPTKSITREEMAVMLNRALSYSEISFQPNQSFLKRFSDKSKISSWALSGVAVSVTEGLMSGRNGNLFAPKSGTTRGEAMAILHRLYNKL